MPDDVIGIVGLGLLGRGIATCFLAHGFRVVAYTKGGEDAFTAARKYIATGIQEVVAHTGADAELSTSWASRYIEAADLAEFSSCKFIVESVTEDYRAKEEVFHQLERIVGPEIPIASNTSALPITALQEGRRYPRRFLGMHWAEPAYATRFLELIRGERTCDGTMEVAAALGRRLGKDPCIVQRDVPGFIVNRLGYAMYREAIHLLESGVADIDTIDRSFRNALGLWASFCGPFRWMDITGGPSLYAKAMRGVLPTLRNEAELPETLEEMPSDRLFYSYKPGDIERWHDLLHKQAWAVRALQRSMEAEGAEPDPR